ncbi:4,5-dihydroxyphthalate decarboxylase [Noviherbaspirillum humi]|uniref:4,5-dihydroxyphthalate decarboxylase n=1 Tax=Noviherbaspirillum humi TaxID=1688639 RepID=A0A239IMV7_9BURK|nr:4,5-dihydroxyphthalate decarboxylase [Noviherbaspirillum humi]SNS94871.1 4,5-dihydroxyphthalate decarboxylase [Noviherbaspirillum humi]
MTDRKLKTALQTMGHTRALKNGAVRPQTFDFEFEEVPAIIQAFRRMVRGLEFDISEMAITTYITARAYGKRITALPLPVMRAYHHGAMKVNSTLGITDPKQLEGRRVGVNRGYTVTAGVWARAVLQHEYGVDLSKITWVLSGDEHVAEFQAPGNVVPVEAGRKLEDMLIAGELAAASGIEIDQPNVKPLLPNAAELGFTALRERGYYPINHLVVVKDELLEAQPGLATDIFNAFVAAKQPYLEELKTGQFSAPGKNDDTYRRVMQITGKDPLPYGVEPNRKMIEAVIRYATEQGILKQPFTVDELFAAETLKLEG